MATTPYKHTYPTFGPTRSTAYVDSGGSDKVIQTSRSCKTIQFTAKMSISESLLKSNPEHYSEDIPRKLADELAKRIIGEMKIIEQKNELDDSRTFYAVLNMIKEAE